MLQTSLLHATKEKNAVDRRIELPTGGTVTIRSADAPVSLLGDGLDGLVIDEAAFVDENTWNLLRPALADKQGWAWFISTPRGYNWFYDLYQAAETRANWSAWQGPTTTATVTQTELDELREELHPNEYREQIDAEFVDLAGDVFKRSWIRYFQAENGCYHLSGNRSIDVDRCWGLLTVDLAASLKESADYTVVSSWHVTKERDLLLVDCHRERLEGPDQVGLIERRAQEFSPRVVLVESTAYQLTMVQQLRRRGLPVKEVRPVKDKVARALTFASRMSSGDSIGGVYFNRKLHNLRDLEMELIAFPNARHDDFVDTCSLAAEAIYKSQKPRVKRII
jgi:predicted phage terminase large subunit-like protein